MVRRLRAWLPRGRLDDELAEEMRLHVEMRRDALVAGGMDPREAAWEAQRRFGNLTAIREETRDMWGFPTIDTLMQDLRFGARMLRRTPVFSATAILSLAIGIGASTAVFSLANEVGGPRAHLLEGQQRERGARVLAVALRAVAVQRGEREAAGVEPAQDDEGVGVGDWQSRCCCRVSASMACWPTR
jgi:hypothetical protein